jgi:hypothetical protein
LLDDAAGDVSGIVAASVAVILRRVLSLIFAV